MYNIKNITLFSFFLLFSFSFCKNESKPAVVLEKKSIPQFIANPQVIASQDIKPLEIGMSAPDFNLPATDGQFYSLKDFKKAEVLVIVFTCNHCKMAQVYEDVLIKLTKNYAAKSVKIVAISPNSPLALSFEMQNNTDLGDTYDEMIQRAKDKNINYPYLYDGDKHEAALAYQPEVTPQVFVFDTERKARYIGNIGNNDNADNLEMAINAILNKKEIKTPRTKAKGCTVKWSWEYETVTKANEIWNSKPIELNELDKEGVKKLLEDNGGQKMRLVNFWASWCAPCIVEFPEFIKMQRMYGTDDFEFITISADKIKEKKTALKFLKERYAATQNYIYNGKDANDLIPVVDENWDGELPYSMLIASDGKVIYRHSGIIDPLEIKRLIVGN